MKKLGFMATAVGLSLSGWMLHHFTADRTEPVVVEMTPGPSQPRVTLQEAGIDPAALEAAVAYAAPRNTTALVVGHGGHIVFEKYWGDIHFDTPVEPGFDPVLTALLVGAAMNDRLIPNPDRPLSNYVADLDGGEAAFTLRDLLGGQAPGVPVGDRAELLALAIEAVGKQPYETAVAERLWRTLGGGTLVFDRRQRARWRPGRVAAGCCVAARVGDWMRVGEALAHDGVFEANQLTPPGFVTRMLRPAAKDSPYGYFTRLDGTFAAADTAWVEGRNQQRLWVVPSLRLYILRLGDAPPASEGWEEAMIPDTIIRATRGWQPRRADDRPDPGKFAPH